MDDQQIVALYCERSQAAIQQTDSKYGSLFRNLAYKLLSDRQDADECVSDTYLAAWNTIPPELPVSLPAYLSKILRNLAMKRLEHRSAAKRRSEAEVSFDELQMYICDTDALQDKMDELVLRESIIAFLREQAPESRGMFIRRYFFFDSVKEIASRYGVSQSKVKVNLMRTRNKLKEHLIKEELIYER